MYTLIYAYLRYNSILRVGPTIIINWFTKIHFARQECGILREIFIAKLSRTAMMKMRKRSNA